MSVTLGNVALMSSAWGWAPYVEQPRFDMSVYYNFVFGGLEHFDLTDLIAALVTGVRAPSVLVASPTDAHPHPSVLNASTAKAVFGFAQELGGESVTVTTDADVTDALLNWIRQV